LAHLVQRKGERISPEDAVRIFNAAVINLNLHSSVRSRELVSHGDFVNPRTFEIASCGSFQLVDNRKLLPELFASDELAVFDSMDELKDKIIYYKTRPEERKCFAERGRKRVLLEHTYAGRMRTLLDFAAKCLPGFGARKEPLWPVDMPPEMRIAVTDLMRELQLPENADFADVITAVREKNERLSDVEAALLFLDEWKKLYSS
jgi:spore maturation protein CgeB